MRWVQLHDRLNIHWNCLSFGLERKLIFSSTGATNEFSKFADILNAAYLQPHSLEILNSSAGILSPSLAFLVVMLPKAHLTSYSSISGLCKWPQHHPYPGHYDHFCMVLLCILANSSYSHLLLLGLWILCPFVPIFAWSVPLVSPLSLNSSKSLQLYCFPLILSIFTYEDVLISPCYSLEVCIPLGISFPFSFAFHFSYFLSYL